jgi:uncharacterized protein DUF3617
MLRYCEWLAVTAVVATLVAAPAAWAIDMQDGLWEVTTRMDMPGMPAGMGAHTMQHCYTKKDVQNPKDTLPKDGQCTVTEFNVQGNTTTWTMQCTGDHAMTGRGSMTYRGTSYAGTVNMQMKQDGQAMNMTQHIEGRRIGACQ